MFKQSYGTLDCKRGAVLKKMAKVGPFIMATYSEYTMKCANSKCRCQKNKKYEHPTGRLSWTDSQGNGTCYVPVNLRKEVKEWVNNYWKMKALMKDMTILSRRMIKMYAKTLGKVKREQKSKPRM